MYIIVAGAGLVGGELARKLLENKHDVVIIDSHKESCDKLYAETGAVVIQGSAARIDILQEANIEKADVVVGATGNDADNLACAILAKSFGVPQIIVRMRDPAYENAYKVAGVNTIIQVTHMLINQIMMDIEKPQAQRIATLVGGKADIFKIVIPGDTNIIGKTIMDITNNEKFPSQCVFIAVHNKANDDFSIPRGQQVINEGDEIYLISSAADINSVVSIITAKN